MHTTLANPRTATRVSESLGSMEQRKLEQILNALPDGVAVTNSDGVITLANDTLSALLNLEQNGGISADCNLEDALGMANAENSDSVMQKLKQRSVPIAFELQRSTKVSAGVLSVTRIPLVGQDAEPDSFVWSIRDITQQKLTEETRHQSVATAIHDLRTPLANIKAYAETLVILDDIDVEQRKEFCDTINGEAAHLAQFVDKVLSISQTQAGSISLAPSETDGELR